MIDEQPYKLYYSNDEVEELKTASFWAGVLSTFVGLGLVAVVVGFVFSI